MQFIEKQRQPSRKCDDLMKEVLLELDFEKMPTCICKRYKKFIKGAPVNYCARSCDFKCPRFLNLAWVFDMCNNMDCDSSIPCFDCVSKVEKVKVLILSIQSIYMNKTACLIRIDKFQKRK